MGTFWESGFWATGFWADGFWGDLNVPKWKDGPYLMIPMGGGIVYLKQL